MLLICRLLDFDLLLVWQLLLFKGNILVISLIVVCFCNFVISRKGEKG